MASIFCVTNGLAGILYSSIELARRLKAAGHTVIYLSYPQYREIVQNHGLDFLALQPSRYEAFMASDARRGKLSKLRELRRRREQATDCMAPREFVDAIAAAAPDIILIDGEMHEQIITASAMSVPVALLNAFVSIWRRPGLPPPHQLARPGVGWRGTRLGCSLMWSAFWLRKQRRSLSQLVRYVGCDRRSILRRLACRSGFDFDGETDDRHWLIPFTYAHLPVLSLHALEFEFPHRPLPWVHYIGPMLLQSRLDTRINAQVRAELETVYRLRRDSGGTRKLIYAAFGSFFSTELSLLQRLFEVIEARHDWDLVLSLGGQVGLRELGPLPERVHVFAWLPQAEVLQHSDVAVTHGGINTIDECVIHGVPMLVYCDFKTDMAGNTSRVIHHRIGLAGDRQNDSVETIEGHIDRLMRVPIFTDSTQSLRSHYLAYSENHVAEQTVEALLKNRESCLPGYQR